jgi:hypothetical protein
MIIRGLFAGDQNLDAHRAQAVQELLVRPGIGYQGGDARNGGN